MKNSKAKAKRSKPITDTDRLSFLESDIKRNLYTYNTIYCHRGEKKPWICRHEPKSDSAFERFDNLRSAIDEAIRRSNKLVRVAGGKK